ncbi:MAG: type II toxin-antitoxin system RelE/ParE family toxin [Snowella sp.]|nr:MAG: type II toxin-antitoxin system RelE/ParE family toxin [Snowella sp.]
MPDSSDNVKRLPVEFYRSKKGIEPVRDWLKSLDNLDKTKIGQAVKMLEYGWPVGMPTCRPLRNGLYEVRTTLPSNREARIFFCIHNERMVLLHGIIKKTQKTPQRDLTIARNRQSLVRQIND